MAAFFLTGTDTSIGKTTVACALLQVANQQGLSSLGIKPIASGCEQTDEGLRNSDALLLQQYSSLKLPYQEVNPITLLEPLSPHLAAKKAGRRLTMNQLVGYTRATLTHRPQFCVVEGAGGWRVPINDREMLSALPKELNLPVILVVGMRLGCLNHAVLTAEAIIKDGLRLVGWVANTIDPTMAAFDENLATLKQILPAPCLGVLPYDAELHIEKLVNYLNLDVLLAKPV
jgi:dethiobiotin synthetase